MFNVITYLSQTGRSLSFRYTVTQSSFN